MGKLKDELKLYNPTVIDHFLSPRNVGEIKDASRVATSENPVCQDLVKLYLRIEGDTITQARMKTFGCTIAIASASALTELVTGMKVEEARRVTHEDIVRKLGGLPEHKVRCTTTAARALAEALKEG